jgi:hypothetical protein
MHDENENSQSRHTSNDCILKILYKPTFKEIPLLMYNADRERNCKSLACQQSHQNYSNERSITK